MEEIKERDLEFLRGSKGRTPHRILIPSESLRNDLQKLSTNICNMA